MARYFFKIDGVDIAPLIARKGLKWTRNDIDSANAGRTLDGTMNRGRVCMKVKMEIKCIPLKLNQINTILKLINPEYVNVEYNDPLYGHRYATFYSNNVPSTFCFEGDDGEQYYDDLSFPLVER